MSGMPRASVIINSYNYGRFLPAAIESALAQTYPNTEVIVVDDGSTDNSRDVFERYRGHLMALPQKNGGQGAAYNTGFAASGGDFVCFLDADDTLNPDAMSQAIAAFDNSCFVKVEWQMDIIDASGRKTGGVVPEKPTPQINLREHTISSGPLYDWWITPPGSGTCYRRSMLERMLPMPAGEHRHGADVYLTVLTPVFGNVRRLTGAFGCYRQHDRNNYFGRALTTDRLQDYLCRFESYCDAVQRQLASQGMNVSTEEWKRRNFNYLWPSRLLKAKEEVKHLIPNGADYVLIDNDELASDCLAPGRRAIPFVERDGTYFGPPPDDQSAIAELERQTSQGIRFVVFWWTAFWWLAEYVTLNEYLQVHATRLLENDALKVFQLRSPNMQSRCASRS